jgi:hypothetical protein
VSFAAPQQRYRHVLERMLGDVSTSLIQLSKASRRYLT